MSVMAAEPAAAATAGAVAGGEGREKSRGTLLALGIVLLWLAGVAFYFAFEGVLATEQADTTGGGLLKAFLGQVSDNVKASAAANKAAEGG